MLTRWMFTLVLLSVSLLACTGCKDKVENFVPINIENEPPSVEDMVDSNAIALAPFVLDLTAFVEDDNDEVSSLTFHVISGGGSFIGAVYSNTFSDKGNYTVEFLVSDSGGSGTVASFDVLVSAPEIKPQVSFTAAPPYGSAPVTVTFTDNSFAAIDTWLWDFGDTGTSTEQNPEHIYNSPGWYDVSLTVNGPGGSDSCTYYSCVHVAGGSSNIWYVDAGVVSTTGDGSSWETAFQVIQSGINAATDGDLVLVADGAYAGTSNTELDFDGRLICLQAAGENCTIDCKYISRAFSFTNFETVDAVVSGFNIVNGYSSGDGGAIYCLGASPTISNCTISHCTAYFNGGAICSAFCTPIISNCVMTSNHARNAGAVGLGQTTSTSLIISCSFRNNFAIECGGAFLYSSNAPVMIDHCTFYNNYAGYDGCIFADGNCSMTITDSALSNNASLRGGTIMVQGHSSIWLSGCNVSDNKAYENGGAVCADAGCNLDVDGCTFSGNSAGSKGAVFYCESDEIVTVNVTNTTIEDNTSPNCWGTIYLIYCCDTTFKNCTIKDNYAAMLGGLYINNDDSVNVTSVVMEDCLISDNSAIMGAGMLCSHTHLGFSMKNCIVTGNSADGFAGLYLAMGGGLRAPATLTNCLIAGNRAEQDGAGILTAGTSDLILNNCTIAGNTAGSFGSGLYFMSEYDHATLNNTIIWGNSATEGSTIYFAEAATLDIISSDYSNSIGDIVLNSGTLNATACISLDPLFVDAPNGDCRLGFYPLLSPCIDSGDNTLVPGTATTDLDGKARIVNGTVDLGAYEKQ